MLPSRKTRVFVSKVLTEMRVSFDSLYKKTKSLIGLDPKSGHVFLFMNRGKNRVEVLFYDEIFCPVVVETFNGVLSNFNHKVLVYYLWL